MGEKALEILKSDRSRLEIIQGVAEKDCPQPNSVDLVMTSPPYWSVEQYQGGNQSFLYGAYENWKEKFLKCFIQNSFNSLKEDGYFVLNIQNVMVKGKTIPLVEDSDTLAREIGFKRAFRCWYPLSRVGTQRPDEPILVYRKIDICEGGEPVWDLTEQHITKASNSELGYPHCAKCGIELEGPNRDVRHCDTCKHELDATRARERRAEHRKETPVKETRVFTCKTCGVQWETAEAGSFRKCTKCKEEEARKKHTKVCEYRHCGEEFLDESSKNSMKYCCEEHRRREKLFRSGLAKDESYFRSEKEVGIWTCQVCHETFKNEPGTKLNRCPKCREAARQKACQKCATAFRDDSENNTRRYCDRCQEKPAKNDLERVREVGVFDW
jgi:hypothetical protein